MRISFFLALGVILSMIVLTLYSPLELTRCILMWEHRGFMYPDWYRMWEELLVIWGGYGLGILGISLFLWGILKRTESSRYEDAINILKRRNEGRNGRRV